MKDAYFTIEALDPQADYLRLKAHDTESKEELGLVETCRINNPILVDSWQIDGMEGEVAMEEPVELHTGYLNSVLSLYHQAHDIGYELSFDPVVIEPGTETNGGKA